MENLVPTPRTSEVEEDEIDLDPEQLTITTKKECNVSQARGDSMLKLSAKFARTVDLGQIFYMANESVSEGNSSPPSCREDSEQ